MEKCRYRPYYKNFKNLILFFFEKFEINFKNILEKSNLKNKNTKR